MGQKVHPIGFRLGITKDWTSKWYADSKEYAEILNTDLKVRKFLKKKLYQGIRQPYTNQSTGEECAHNGAHGASGFGNW